MNDLSDIMPGSRNMKFSCIYYAITHMGRGGGGGGVKFIALYFWAYFSPLFKSLWNQGNVCQRRGVAACMYF